MGKILKDEVVEFWTRICPIWKSFIQLKVNGRKMFIFHAIQVFNGLKWRLWLNE